MNDIALKKYKKDFHYSYTFGTFTTLELLEHKREQIIKVIITESDRENEGISKIVTFCHNYDIEYVYSNSQLRKIAPQENFHAVGIFNKYDMKISNDDNHIVLVNPTFAGNLGTIIRTALGFGITNLAIINPSPDVFNPEVIRASMGSLFQIQVQYFNSFSEYQNVSTDHNLYPFMVNAGHSLSTTSFSTPFSLIFGSEGAGLPPEFIHIGTPVSIEQKDTVDSLNLAVAVGIVAHKTFTNQ